MCYVLLLRLRHGMTKMRRKRRSALDRPEAADIIARVGRTSSWDSATATVDLGGGTMIRNRAMGITAALGGMTAMVALLTGLSTARADELADLKANQELLKQRIDQLALGAPAPVPPGAPSMAGSFPRSFLIPGTDTSLLIGGYVKLDAAYWMSGGSPNGNAAASLNGGAPVASSTPLDLHGTGIYAAPTFNPHSRGATFQM